MPFSTSNTLEVLAAHNIHPLEDEFSDIELPGIGGIAEGETVYSTSIDEVLGEEQDGVSGEILAPDDRQLGQWQEELERIIREGNIPARARPPEPPEPHCAWYCPIHYFGHGWGIYIREGCILSYALDIAQFIHWPSVRVRRWDIPRHLLRSAFYVFFLHEQFHHKVESLGFRLLVSTGTDRYRPYKQNVYRPNFLTSDCLEESLANAESYRRVSEPRYKKRLDPAIYEGLRQYLKTSIPSQPPGYCEGIHYFADDPYRDAIYRLQSMIVDAKIPPTTPPNYWSVAPNMITSIADITKDIYVVLPRGARPIFRPTSIDPGATASSRALEDALTRHYGYQPVTGGKGSHVKLKKAGGQTIILPGNRPVVSPGVVKHVLDAVGGHPISRLPDLLAGRL
jgi:hypothetical protein